MMNFIHILLLILISGCVSKEPDFSPLGKQGSPFGNQGSPFFITQIAAQTIAPFGGSSAGAQWCEKVVIDHLENIICIGETNGSLVAPVIGMFDIIVAKFNKYGKLLWVKQMGSAGADLGYSIGVDQDGNIYGAGYTNNIMAPSSYLDNAVPRAGGNTDYDPYVFKLNPSGDIIWKKQFGSTANDYCFDLVVTPNGSSYCTGGTEGVIGTTYGGATEIFGGVEDSYVAKLDSGGNIQWIRQLGTTNSSGSATNYERSKNLHLDANGNVWSAGDTRSNLFEANGGVFDIFFWVLDSSGSLVKTKQFGSATSGGNYFPSHQENVGDFVTDSSGNLYFSIIGLGGFENNIPATDEEIVIIKTDSFFNFIWSERFGMNSTERALALEMTPSNTLMLAGYTDGNLFATNLTGFNDIFMMELDLNGTTLFSKQLGSSGGDIATTVVVDNNGYITIGGYTNGSFGEANDNSTDFFILRVGANGEL